MDHDGSSYVGEWMNDVQQGFGIQKWLDGSFYEGYMQNYVVITKADSSMAEAPSDGPTATFMRAISIETRSKATGK